MKNTNKGKSPADAANTSGQSFAFNLGADFARAGRSIDDNPYDKTFASAYHMFRAGYLLADANFEEVDVCPA